MLNAIRYLSFEINATCDKAALHKGKCPISHPERYLYSRSFFPLTEDDILGTWRWLRTHCFRGMVMWHMYNEPTLVLGRIRALMHRMKEEDPCQGFQITTNSEEKLSDFEIVKYSRYEDKTDLDNRIETAEGEGKPYEEMPKRGWCGRGLGWEIPIDHYGNWCLCCGDWRCEEAIGNIHHESMEVLHSRWEMKRQRIRWNNEKEYYALPRLCRACLDKNPSLSGRGGV